MLSPQTKENNSPELPSPPTNTLSHPNPSSPTCHSPSNVSRKRAPRLPALAHTPARPSFSQQMLKHWSTSTPKLPQEHVVSVQRDCSSPNDTCISSEEDPLNHLERAVAMVLPHSPKSKQRRKTLFIPGQKATKVAMSPGRCKREGLGSPLRNCVVRTPEEKPRRGAELLSEDSEDFTCVTTKAEADEIDEDAFVTARQDMPDGIDDLQDSAKCDSAQESSVEAPLKAFKGTRFVDMRRGPLYPKLLESANSTDLDLSPAPARTSKHMQIT
ncbi:hypothetical protein AC578_5307 [Pseudocercospora eumusae]|uniref:Uncharacterized protein n=1 Tax=Pseudocercospora eumusae TaxID=321146 RepID=A0A139GZW2_9PEZI|nr:hypothetical protein AC578_5307 [Pseudocercospora eumusae]KXS95752.1 hypothetical protein AC578_5307 [Pseudocercospora eumusae]